MIEARHLTKYFGQTLAVDDVSFKVEKGEVLGFLGPNGAGKSTTMRMITGFLYPSSGTAVIGDQDMTQSPLKARRKLGYLPENAPVYQDMTVEGFLGFIAEIRGLSGRERDRRIDETLERCFLSHVRHQPIDTLSKGYKQRVCFAQSILHDPEYLVMDEPTDGLDPNQKHEVRSMIQEMAHRKVIILSTHILEEVEAVCTRAIIVAGGKIVADDTPQNLKARSAIHGALLCTIRGAGKAELESGFMKMECVKAFQVLEEDDKKTVIRLFPRKDAVPPHEQVIRFCADRGYGLESFRVEEGHLDEVFRMITLSGDDEAGR
jgi:ABC-2 type transport system ATP-binding protein